MRRHGVIRKNVFIKNDIPRNKKGFGLNAIQFTISLDAKMISKKYIKPCPWSKLGSTMRERISITKEAKDL